MVGHDPSKDEEQRGTMNTTLHVGLDGIAGLEKCRILWTCLFASWVIPTFGKLASRTSFPFQKTRPPQVSRQNQKRAAPKMLKPRRYFPFYCYFFCLVVASDLEWPLWLKWDGLNPESQSEISFPSLEQFPIAFQRKGRKRGWQNLISGSLDCLPRNREEEERKQLQIYSERIWQWFKKNTELGIEMCQNPRRKQKSSAKQHCTK